AAARLRLSLRHHVIALQCAADGALRLRFFHAVRPCPLLARFWRTPDLPSKTCSIQSQPHGKSKHDDVRGRLVMIRALKRIGYRRIALDVHDPLPDKSVRGVTLPFKILASRGARDLEPARRPPARPSPEWGEGG